MQSQCSMTRSFISLHFHNTQRDLAQDAQLIPAAIDLGLIDGIAAHGKKQHLLALIVHALDRGLAVYEHGADIALGNFLPFFDDDQAAIRDTREIHAIPHDPQGKGASPRVF